MYKLRDTFPTNDERSRQHKIQKIIIGELPVTRVEKLAASILNNEYINSSRSFKLEKNIQAIQSILNTNDLTDDALIFEKRRPILQLVENTKFQIGDKFQLSFKSKIPTWFPEPNKQSIIQWSVLPSINVSLADFQQLLFNNKIIQPYYKNINFVDYIVTNLKYFLDIQEIEEITDNLLDQAKLLLFIDKTDYNEYTLIRAFYDNTLTYNNVIFDTSFVPKYPVLELKHQFEPIINNDYAKEIEYWNSIDLSTIQSIPLEYLAIFMVFPFKNGFYVQPDGKIMKIPVKLQNRMSLINTLDSICSINDLEAILDETSKFYSIEEVLNWTLYEKSLRNVGLGILLLRRYYGNILTINPFKIALPTEYNVLSWLSLQCTNKNSSKGIILPINDDSRHSIDKLNQTAIITIALIRDIISSCQTAFGASVLCSNYCILEIDMYKVFKQLKTPTEKYVFLLLIYQYYPYYNYHRAIKALHTQVTFGRDTTIDVLKLYKPSIRRYVNASIETKLSTISMEIVRPQDLNNKVVTCSPSLCPDLYEFTDPQLNELAKTNSVTFYTPKQIANYIDLCM